MLGTLLLPPPPPPQLLQDTVHGMTSPLRVIPAKLAAKLTPHSRATRSICDGRNTHPPATTVADIRPRRRQCIGTLSTAAVRSRANNKSRGRQPTTHPAYKATRKKKMIPWRSNRTDAGTQLLAKCDITIVLDEEHMQRGHALPPSPLSRPMELWEHATGQAHSVLHAVGPRFCLLSSCVVIPSSRVALLTCSDPSR